MCQCVGYECEKELVLSIDTFASNKCILTLDYGVRTCPLLKARQSCHVVKTSLTVQGSSQNFRRRQCSQFEVIFFSCMRACKHVFCMYAEQNTCPHFHMHMPSRLNCYNFVAKKRREKITYCLLRNIATVIPFFCNFNFKLFIFYKATLRKLKMSKNCEFLKCYF